MRSGTSLTNALLEGAKAEVVVAGCVPTVVYAPGAWEIPLLIRHHLEETKPYAVVAVGCVLQGQTAHAQLLARDVSSALMSLQMSHGVPIGWGILTPDTAEQALERAGMKHGNKGREAAMAALATAALLEKPR
ncbi:MAG: 6,7-dimethyl-8-ribityllumazine synthase [Armatimonadota bacterium]